MPVSCMCTCTGAPFPYCLRMFKLSSIPSPSRFSCPSCQLATGMAERDTTRTMPHMFLQPIIVGEQNNAMLVTQRAAIKSDTGHLQFTPQPRQFERKTYAASTACAHSYAPVPPRPLSRRFPRFSLCVVLFVFVLFSASSRLISSHLGGCAPTGGKRSKGKGKKQ